MISFSNVCAVAVLLSAFVGCGGAENAEAQSQQSEASVLSQASLTGAWSTEGGLLIGITLQADGHFVRDRQRILNGLFIGNVVPGFIHDEGTYEVEGNARTLTLHVAAQPDVAPVTQTFVYEYTPSPGGASLTLTQTAAPGSGVTYASIPLRLVPSFCVADSECAAPTSSCASSSHACVATTPAAP